LRNLLEEIDLADQAGLTLIDNPFKILDINLLNVAALTHLAG
jgi:hypothetical protein